MKKRRQDSLAQVKHDMLMKSLIKLPGSDTASLKPMSLEGTNDASLIPISDSALFNRPVTIPGNNNPSGSPAASHPYLAIRYPWGSNADKFESLSANEGLEENKKPWKETTEQGKSLIELAGKLGPTGELIAHTGKWILNVASSGFNVISDATVINADPDYVLSKEDLVKNSEQGVIVNANLNTEKEDVKDLFKEKIRNSPIGEYFGVKIEKEE